MTDLVSQLVAQLEDMRGKVIELCQTYGNALPHGSLERTDAALTAAKAGGWVAVPVEPTVDMLVAAHDAEHCGTHEPHFANAYRAMLAARPTTPPEGASVTTTQPAALPELTPLTGDILIEDQTIYVLNKNGENVWRATVYPGFHDNGIRVSDDQCRAVAANLARLATLQPQPQPAAAVSDEEIRHDANLPFVEDEHGAEWVTLSPAMFARSVRRVLALRPQAVPMTDEHVDRVCMRTPMLYSRKMRDRQIWRAAEAHHGIPAQGAQGEQG